MALTPGKWEFYQTGSYEVSYGIKAPAPRHWVIPPLNLNPDDVRLMSAAPELLDALKDALCALEVCGKDYSYVESKARAAIAKATGHCLKGEE